MYFKSYISDLKQYDLKYIFKKNYRFPPRAANKTTTKGPAARIKTRLVS